MQGMETRIKAVSPETFAAVVKIAAYAHPQGEDNLTIHEPEWFTGACYLTEDGLSGFAVQADGEFVNLFSLKPRRGLYLVERAIREGATHLDCLEGYLSRLYDACGFREVRRERNWQEGGPDVVYMALPA